jgi:ribosome-associated protein
VRINERVSIPDGELQWRFTRSGGPGGQHVNTSSTRVEVIFDLKSTTSISYFLKRRAMDRLGKRLVDGTLTVSSSNERSQLLNRRNAEERLAQIIREAIAPPPPSRRATRPTRSSQTTRVADKRRRSEIKKNRNRPRDDD